MRAVPDAGVVLIHRDPAKVVASSCSILNLFFDLGFKYDEDQKEHVISDISFEIQPGEKVAFIGPTGSGKSTIIKLLTRFYEPDKGSIYLDDKLLSIVSRESLRNKIGVDLQKAFDTVNRAHLWKRLISFSHSLCCDKLNK